MHGIHKDELRRKNHNVVERQRRSEQRDLFDKLQYLLRADPKTPRLQLLTMVSVSTFAVRTAITSNNMIQVMRG